MIFLSHSRTGQPRPKYLKKIIYMVLQEKEFMKNETKFSEKNFALFNLDTNFYLPNSWLWCKFNVSNLKQAYIKVLEKETQKTIAQLIATKLRCGRSTIEKHLITLKEAEKECSLPIIVVEELIQYIDPTIKDKINVDISLLFYTNQKSKPIKAVHSLSIELAEIMGAFAADGYFHESKSDYYIKVTEGNKDTIIALADKLEQVFEYEPRFTFADNAWNLWIKNKVICKYFKCMFGFKPGKKSYTICMSDIIKEDLELQKAFVRGVFTFDGCIKTNGNVSLSTKSKALIDDVVRILETENISYRSRFDEKNNFWNLESNSGRNPALLNQWKEFFFLDTIKYKRIQFFLGESPSNSLEELFPEHHHSKITLNQLYELLKKNNKAEIEDLAQLLKVNDIQIANTTLYKYLHILEKANLIRKETYRVKTSKNAFTKAVYFIIKDTPI